MLGRLLCSVGGRLDEVISEIMRLTEVRSLFLSKDISLFSTMFSLNGSSVFG